MKEEKNKLKKVFEIPEQGALGLLALGADGIKAWKEKKKKGPLTPEGGIKESPATPNATGISKDNEQPNGE